MYNQEIKGRFLATRYPNARDNGAKIALFNRIASTEESLCKDAAEFSESDARIAMSESGIIERTTLQTFKSMMRVYTSWCSSERIFPVVTDHIAKTDPSPKDVAAQVSSTLFKDEEDLFRSMKKVRPFLDEGRLDIVIVAMAWIGIEKAKVLEVLDSEVDLEGRVFRDHDGRTLAAGYSDEIAEVFRQYVRCDEAIRRTGTGERVVCKDRSLPFFLKNFYKKGSAKMGTPMKSRAVSSFVEDINVEYTEKGYKGRFTYGNILLSGRLNRLFQLEESGVCVEDPENAGIVEAVFSGSKRYVNIMPVYASYKRAFNL